MDEQLSAEASYFREFSNHLLLNAEKEREVIRRAQAGDEQATETIVRANQRLVISWANKYRHLGDLMDLIQFGNMGLLEALRRFDPERGLRFSTYAVHWIRCVINRRGMMTGHSVHIPIHLQEDRIKVNRARSILYQRLKRKPTAEELQAETGVSVEKINKFPDLFSRPASLDSFTEMEDGATDDDVYDLISQNAESPEDFSLRSETTQMITKCLENLTPKERQVIILRFGLDGGPHRTLTEVGEACGFSRERARQLEARAKYQLKKALTLCGFKA